MFNSFSKFAVSQAPDQDFLINPLVEKSPLLNSMVTKGSSNGLTHSYPLQTDIVAMGSNDLDAPMNVVSADKKVGSVKLQKFDGILKAGVDAIEQLGGMNNYFNDQAQAILQKTGNEIEKAIIYDKMQSFCSLNGKVYSSGGAGGNYYSIIAVTWDRLSTSAIIDGTPNQGMFQLTPYSTATTPLLSDDNREYHALGFKMYMNLMLADKRQISCLSNITEESITSLQIMNLLTSARADQNTVLYMHPYMLNIIKNKFKLESLRFSNSDNDINPAVNFFETTPIITSWSFSEGKESELLSV
jgi:hypothetical protein